MARNHEQETEEREKDLIDWEFGLTSIQGSVYMSHIVIHRAVSHPGHVPGHVSGAVSLVCAHLLRELDSLEGHPVLGRRCKAMATAIRERYVLGEQEKP